MVTTANNPRAISEERFPITGTAAQQWEFLLNYALLAPSEHNTQPWLFKIDGPTVEMYADLSRRLPIADSENRELLISCGAALFNLRVALRHFGHRDQVEVNRLDNLADWVARIHNMGRKEPATLEEHLLFAALPRRRSNRQPFSEQPIPPQYLALLAEQVNTGGCWIQLAQEQGLREAITQLIVAGDRTQWSDQHFRQELANWVRSREHNQTDGMPGYVRGKGSIAGGTSPFVVRTFDLWRTEVEKDKKLVAAAPVLAVLGTFFDTPADWLQVGQVAEQLLLQTTSLGIQTSFVNQPVEIPGLRSWLSQLLELKGDFPQLVLRLGYGPEAPLTPRRHVSEVLFARIDG